MITVRLSELLAQASKAGYTLKNVEKLCEQLAYNPSISLPGNSIDELPGLDELDIADYDAIRLAAEGKNYSDGSGSKAPFNIAGKKL